MFLLSNIVSSAPSKSDISFSPKLSISISISHAIQLDFPKLSQFPSVCFRMPSGFDIPPSPKKNVLSPVYDFIFSLLDT